MKMNLAQLKNKYNMNIKGVIHIGAHIGSEYSVYKNLNINNLMFFEPLPHTFEKLKININDDNVNLYNMALGNKIGKAEMYVEYDNESQSSSLLEPLLHATQYPFIVFNDKIEIDIQKLDNIKFEKNNYNFINIDVQGYELEVFKGSVDTLENIDYIMSEVNKVELYKNCVIIEELDSFLYSFGFNRYDTFWHSDYTFFNH